MSALGFIQLRRGILEHIESGRLSSDEFSAYAIIILKADHRTGVWSGSGRSMARSLHWSIRKSQTILLSLESKSYILINRPSQFSNAEITVSKYFPGVSSLAQECIQSSAECIQNGVVGVSITSRGVSSLAGKIQEEEVIQEGEVYNEASQALGLPQAAFPKPQKKEKQQRNGYRTPVQRETKPFVNFTEERRKAEEKEETDYAERVSRVANQVAARMVSRVREKVKR